METLEEVNKDPEFREYMSAEEDERKMENSHLDEARAEGISQGKNERNIEIAKKLLKNKVDISIIVDSTGLTKDEIEKIKETSW